MTGSEPGSREDETVASSEELPVFPSSRHPVYRIPAFASLRHRDFRLFLSGQFLSQCGTWIEQVGTGWLVVTLSDSPFALGLVFTLGSLPVLLFTLIGGVVADRVNKRRTIMLLQALMATEALALGILTATNTVTVHWVMVLAVFFGFLSAFEVPTRQAFVFDVVGKDDLMNAIALNSSAFNVARVIGPSIAGVLIAAVGLAACFFVNGASFLAVLAGLALMRTREPERTSDRPAMASALREGFDYIRKERWPRTLVILTATITIFGSSFLLMLPVFAKDALKVGASGYGALLSGVGIGAAAAALVIASFGSRFRQGRLALSSAAAFGLSLMLLAPMPHLVPAMAIGMLAGCCMSATGISTNTLLRRLAPDHLRGRVMGFYSFVALGMVPFGSLQAGWVSERFGVRTSFFLNGCVITGTVLVVWLGWLRRRRRERLAYDLPLPAVE
jgi:MFS family permease